MDPSQPLLKLLSCLVMVGSAAICPGQNVPAISNLEIQETEESVTIDGSLDEVIWQTADRATGFQQIFPSDSLRAFSDTEVMLSFDQEYLYVAAICHDTLSSEYVITSLRRDFDWGNNDNFSIYIDPFNDKINGFTFGLSPLGVQREGLIFNGEDVSSDWDNKWFSGVKNYEDRWTLEMAIPFKTIRYNPANRVWNINFLRNNQKQNERTSWIAVPQQYRASNLAFTGTMQWNAVPANSGANIVVIPYISTAINKNHEAGESTDFGFEAGLDAKVAITPSLNLDLTINPDFSQVEVDQQVTNLDRFEIFFPERRQFFLENNDLFGTFGFTSVNPFFSRRIGIAQDTAENNILVPIRYGARLSGKINKDWRVGLLNMQTAADEANMINAQNYTVATFQRQVFGRSSVGGIFVNRQATNYRISDSVNTSRYNRVYGVDYNLVSANNRWEGSVFYHRSDDPGAQDKNFAHGLFARYASRNLRVFYFQQAIGENYNAEIGFVRRTDIRRATLGVEGTFYPSNPNIITRELEVRVSYSADGGFDLTDREVRFEHEINFTNRSALEIGVENTWIKLTSAFDPSGNDGLELPGGSEEQWWSVGAAFESDNRKLLNYEAGISYGGFFNGTRFEFQLESNYRYQPYGGIGLNFTYNHIELPSPYSDSDLFLIGPKIDLTFNKKLFLTTFVQYNNQQDNININSRFQWRYAPISDFFIVYTDNYFPESFRVRNRALVLKLSYWLNV